VSSRVPNDSGWERNHGIIIIHSDITTLAVGHIRIVLFVFLPLAIVADEDLGCR